MPIYQVGDIWYIDIRTPRGRIRRSAGTSDKRAAQEYHDKIKAGTWRESKLGEKSAVTWGQAIEKWLKLKPRGLSDRYNIAGFSIPLSTPLPIPSELILNELSGRSAGTWNRILNLLVAIHSASGFSAPKIHRPDNPKGRIRWLTKEEWAKLKRALLKESPLLAAAAEFSLATGLRENNVLNLEWSQIDLKRRVMWIYADQFKTGTPLGIPLTDAAMTVLASRKGIDESLVFGNPDYVLYKASNRAWYEALRKAGMVGFRWHDLRHTWASWAVMSGVRLEELMKLGGWKTMSMVMRYAHLSPEHLAGVAAKIKPISRGKMRDNKRKSGHNLDIAAGG